MRAPSAAHQRLDGAHGAVPQVSDQVSGQVSVPALHQQPGGQDSSRVSCSSTTADARDMWTGKFRMTQPLASYDFEAVWWFIC